MWLNNEVARFSAHFRYARVPPGWAGIHFLDGMMYLALALRLGTRMITANERLVAAFTSISATTQHIQSVQDFRGT